MLDIVHEWPENDANGRMSDEKEGPRSWEVDFRTLIRSENRVDVRHSRPVSSWTMKRGVTFVRDEQDAPVVAKMRKGEEQSLADVEAQIAAIKSWTAAFKAWPSLGVPVPGADASHWFDDYRLTAYRPSHNPKFTLFVRYTLAGVYRREPTETVTKMTDNYLDLIEKGHDIAPWDSPIELLLCTLLFRDAYQEDFIALARELVDDVNELLGLCCWAIVARQVEHKQKELTRNAVANLVALVLVLKQGPAFKYRDWDFSFKFNDGALEVWMPDFARLWFNIAMPDFCKQPTRIDEFVALLAK